MDAPTAPILMLLPGTSCQASRFSPPFPPSPLLGLEYPDRADRSNVLIVGLPFRPLASCVYSSQSVSTFMGLSILTHLQTLKGLVAPGTCSKPFVNDPETNLSFLQALRLVRFS
jgi:hypothetical protein